MDNNEDVKRYLKGYLGRMISGVLSAIASLAFAGVGIYALHLCFFKLYWGISS